MLSSPITSWQIEGEKVEAVTDFIFLGSKINVDSDCSHEIKRHLLLGRKAMTNLDSILKKQRYYFVNKSLCTLGYGFSSSHVQIRELDHKDSWAWKNWCFWIAVLDRTLESPLDSKEIKPVNPKEINPECSLEGLILKLRLQYCGHLMKRANLLGKTLMLGKTESERRREWQRMRWLDSISDSMDVNLSKLLEKIEDRGAWWIAVLGVTELNTT